MLLKITFASSKRRTGSSTAIIVNASILGAAVIKVKAFRVVWRRWWQPRHISMKAEERFLQELSKLPPRYSYRELQVATNDFSKRLGTGGFGFVYEGILSTPTGVMKVAIKRLDQAGNPIQHNMDHQFKAEVATIGRSLDKWLYEPQAEESSSSVSSKKDTVPFVDSSQEVLNWESRCRIALDTAKGLEYLHHQSAEHILHCDVKPVNRLSDKDFHAKVGDFGLTKLMGSNSQSFAMKTLKGTRGEEVSRSRTWTFTHMVIKTVSAAKDSTSSSTDHGATLDFGTINASLVHDTISTAKDSTSSSTDHGATLDFDTINASLVQDTIMDHCLPRGSVPTDSFQQVLMLALACVQVDLSDRPSMASVVQMLEDILEISYSTTIIQDWPHKATIFCREAFPRSDTTSSTTSCSVSGVASWLRSQQYGIPLLST
ncbi:hypothetical protein L7F22_053611 [Adiantum nelumboides]|nr:hypothetical protein [Adiantum nelumboides]